MTPFETARDELRRFGITLKAVCGEWHLLRKGNPEPLIVVESLTEAVERGRDLAGQNGPILPAIPPLGRKRTRFKDMLRFNNDWWTRNKHRYR